MRPKRTGFNGIADPVAKVGEGSESRMPSWTPLNGGTRLMMASDPSQETREPSRTIAGLRAIPLPPCPQPPSQGLLVPGRKCR